MKGNRRIFLFFEVYCLSEIKFGKGCSKFVWSLYSDPLSQPPPHSFLFVQEAATVAPHGSLDFPDKEKQRAGFHIRYFGMV